MGINKDAHLNPAEARLRKRAKPLQPVSGLAAQYKGQDEGGLGALKAFEMQRRQEAASARRARLSAARQQG